jgi:7-carboxy-7-deazaguanine synthase
VWAREQIGQRGLDRLATVLFSAVHGTLDPAEMARWTLEDGLAVRVQVQLHKVLWPAATRGV